MELLIVLATFYYRIMSAAHEGLSDRGQVTKALNIFVGWWPWHLLAWMKRDVLIFMTYIALFIKEELTFETSIAFMILFGVMHLVTHKIVYGWFEKNRIKFRWGQKKKFWETEERKNMGVKK